MKRATTSPSITTEPASGTLFTAPKNCQPPKANYGFLKEQFIRLTPSTCQCKLFCGGPRCKYCRSDAWGAEQQAIMGLYSSWITDDLLAMARPTTSAILEHNIVDQFVRNGITSIVNLQHAGEHKYCGSALHSSGFSYNPEDFMKKDIFHYNFGWPDFGVSTLPSILDMVKVLSFALNQGKTAVHCHAGLGRTGVLITCYLIWDREMNPGDAIAFARQKRVGMVQTKDQADLVYRFADFLKPLRKVFNKEVNFSEYLSNQQHVLHGVEARILKYIPKITYVICERLSELEGGVPGKKLEQKLLLLASGDEMFYDKILSSKTVEKRPTLDQIRQLSDDLVSVLGKDPTLERQMSEGCALNRAPNLPKLPPITHVAMKPIEEEHPPPPTRDKTWQNALKACLMRYLPGETQNKLELYENSLKHSIDCWRELANESEREVLLALLGSWFHSLKEPCVNVHALMPQGALDGEFKIQANQKWTILYLCNTLGRLCQKDESMRSDTATLLCDWLTWSRDQQAENYLLSCLITVDASDKS